MLPEQTNVTCSRSDTQHLTQVRHGRDVRGRRGSVRLVEIALAVTPPDDHGVDSVCGIVGMPTAVVVNMVMDLPIRGGLERGVREHLFEPCRVIVGGSPTNQGLWCQLASGADRGMRVAVVCDLRLGHEDDIGVCDLRIDRRGDAATAVVQRRDVLEVGGRRQTVDARQTLTFARSGGGWVITEIR